MPVIYIYYPYHLRFKQETNLYPVKEMLREMSREEGLEWLDEAIIEIRK